MRLTAFLFRNKSQQELARLLWCQGLSASVREFSLMSGLSYATTHEELHQMEKSGLVKKIVQGRSTIFSTSLSKTEQNVVNALFSESVFFQKNSTFQSQLLEFGLPYSGNSQDLGDDPVADLEELVARASWKSKRNPTLARALPVMLYKVCPRLHQHRLMFWAHKYDVKKEVGFFIELTGVLSKNSKIKKMSRGFYDQRWSQADFLFEAEKDLQGFQAKLIEVNTPELAKRWFLKMNLGIDSFASLFAKFSKEAP